MKVDPAHAEGAAPALASETMAPENAESQPFPTQVGADAPAAEPDMASIAAVVSENVGHQPASAENEPDWLVVDSADADSAEVAVEPASDMADIADLISDGPPAPKVDLDDSGEMSPEPEMVHTAVAGSESLGLSRPRRKVDPDELAPEIAQSAGDDCIPLSGEPSIAADHTEPPQYKCSARAGGGLQRPLTRFDPKPEGLAQGGLASTAGRAPRGRFSRAAEKAARETDDDSAATDDKEVQVVDSDSDDDLPLEPPDDQDAPEAARPVVVAAAAPVAAKHGDSEGGAWTRSWDKLSSNEQDAARRLGVGGPLRWDRLMSNVWEMAWEDLLPTQCEAATELGFDAGWWNALLGFASGANTADQYDDDYLDDPANDPGAYGEAYSGSYAGPSRDHYTPPPRSTTQRMGINGISPAPGIRRSTMQPQSSARPPRVVFGAHSAPQPSTQPRLSALPRGGSTINALPPKKEVAEEQEAWGKTWAQLSPEEKMLAKQLGVLCWREWDELDAPVWKKPWTRLSPVQREAAAGLGWDQWCWTGH